MQNLRKKIGNLTFLPNTWCVKTKFFISRVWACNAHVRLLQNMAKLSLKYEKVK